MRPHLVLGVFAVALAGCGDADDASDTGTLTLEFSVAGGSVRESPNLQGGMRGAVYGSLYWTYDVRVTGPRDDAPDLADVEVDDVDLDGDVEVSLATWTSPPLEPGTVTFLGFFDVDGNGATDKAPDPGDPVTLPTTNQFAIEAGQEARGTVLFDLVFN